MGIRDLASRSKNDRRTVELSTFDFFENVLDLAELVAPSSLRVGFSDTAIRLRTAWNRAAYTPGAGDFAGRALRDYASESAKRSSS